MEQRAEGRTESRSAGAERAELILIPGLLNDAELWRDQVSGLSGIATCHITDITKGGTLRELAQSVLADAPARFALAGFSLGDMLRRSPALPVTGSRVSLSLIHPFAPIRRSVWLVGMHSTRRPLHGAGSTVSAIAS